MKNNLVLSVFSAVIFAAVLSPEVKAGDKVWLTKGCREFNRGSFSNSGDNLYVSKAGVLQRIRQSDINGDGFIDLLICNSQAHEEYVMPTSYFDVLKEPDRKTRLNIGGINSAISVDDINNDGFEDIVFPCGWNGESWIPNNTIFYGSEKGITNHFIHSLPASGGRSIIGDFNGDSFKDIIFFNGSIDKATLTFFAGSKQGFSQSSTHQLAAPELKQPDGRINNLVSVPDGKGDALLMRLNNGAIAISRFDGQFLNPVPEMLLPADPGFKKEESRWSDGNQYVPEPTPKLIKLNLNNHLYIFVARSNHAMLYPYADGKLDMTNGLKFNIANALSVSAGDVQGKGFKDLVFAARDAHNNKECCFYYPARAAGVFRESDRVPIFTKRATDVTLADLGGKALSLIIMESNTDNSYDGKTLLYKEFKGKKSLEELPLELPCGDARIALAPRIGKRQHLVIAHTRSGNATSLIPVSIFTGSSKGFSPDRKIDLMANGAMDGIFADLDDDGIPDVILANEVEMAPQLNDGSYIYYNSGKGKFAPKADVKLPTARATGFVLADFNRDGLLDIVFSALDEPELTIYYGKGDRKFCKEKIKLAEGFSQLWLYGGDLNLDGYLDIVVPSHSKHGKSCVLFGSAKGFSYDNRYDFNVAPSSTARIADVNGDGYPDVVFGGSYPSLYRPHDSFINIYFGSAKGYDNSRRTMLPCNNADTLAIADLNNDGLLDIVAGSYDDRRTRKLDSYIYWNHPVDGFTPNNRFPIRTEAACGVIVGDFNRDGWKDLALVNHKVNTRHKSYSQVWYNDRGTFSPLNTVKLPSSGPHGMISAPMTDMMNRRASEFYTSRVFKLDSGCRMITASAVMTVPPGNQVKLCLRSADSKNALAAQKWQEVPFDKKISAKKFPGKYFQYRLELIAPDGVGTPRISEVRISFN